MSEIPLPQPPQDPVSPREKPDLKTPPPFQEGKIDAFKLPVEKVKPIVPTVEKSLEQEVKETTFLSAEKMSELRKEFEQPTPLPATPKPLEESVKKEEPFKPFIEQKKEEPKQPPVEPFIPKSVEEEAGPEIEKIPIVSQKEEIIAKVEPILPPVPPLSEEKQIEPVKEEEVASTESPSEENISEKAEPSDESVDMVQEGDVPKLTLQKVEANQPRMRRVRTDAPLPDTTVPTRWARIKDYLKQNMLLVIFIATCLLGGAIAFWIFKETRLVVAVETDGMELNPEVIVVLDFDERVQMLRRELENRRKPIQEMIQNATASLQSAQADLSGKKQARELLNESMNRDKQQIPELFKQTDHSLQVLWDERYAALDREYDKAQGDLRNQIVKRSKDLGLNIKLPGEIKAPEAVVNAFRLALYGVGDKVNAGVERAWAEGLLKNWRQLEEKWAKERTKIRDEAISIRRPMEGKLSDIQKRTATLQNEISGVDEDIQQVQQEVVSFEDRLKEVQKMYAASIESFYQDLLRVPQDFAFLKFNIDAGNVLDVRSIEKRKDFPPGHYRMLIRANRDGLEYWAFQSFDVGPYKTTRLTIHPEAFTSAKKLLE